MKITKQLIESMVREELESILEDDGMGAAPSGREIDSTKFSPDMIANLIDLVANIKNLVRQGASIEDVDRAIKQSESFLKEGMYNKDPRPCADDERYKPPSPNDYRQFGRCVKK